MSEAPAARGGDEAARPGPVADVVAGAVLAVLAVAALFWLIPTQTVVGGNAYDVAPGFFPRVAAVVVLVLAAALVVSGLRRRSTAAGGGWNVLGEAAVWAVVAPLAVVGLATIGFVVTSVLLVACGMIAAGARNRLLIAVVAVLFPLAVDQAAWLVFTVDLP